MIWVAIVWLVLITFVHAWLNLHLFAAGNARGTDQNKFRIGFLPVTCHLTCPVTDFINKQIAGESIFTPLRFNGWPELKEALPKEFILGDATPAPLEKLQGQFRFHILIRGEAIMRLSRLVRETLDKLPFPEDVTVAVDVDPYQLL